MGGHEDGDPFTELQLPAAPGEKAGAVAGRPGGASQRPLGSPFQPDLALPKRGPGLTRGVSLGLSRRRVPGANFLDWKRVSPEVRDASWEGLCQALGERVA